MENPGQSKGSAPKGSCYHFWNTGKCRDGTKCKFKHVDRGGDNNFQKKKEDEPITQQKRDFPSFKRALEMDLKNQHSMRKFVLAALAEESKGDVILELTSAAQMPKLESILQSSFSTNAGSSGEFVSFHRVIVPLCLLLTHEGIANSTHVSATKKLYSMVARQAQFFRRVIQCMDRVLGDGGQLLGDPVGKREWSNVWDPTDPIKHVLLPVCALHVLVLSRVTDAPADPLSLTTQNELEGLAQKMKTCSGIADVQTLLRRSRELMEGFARGPEVQERARVRGQELLDHQVAMQMQLGVEVPLEIQPGPGSTRPGGPRHNNDHVEYRQVQIIPSGEEILCQIDPYLPKADEKVEHLSSETELYLDRQFRLLREDMLGEVRRGIQGFFNERGLKRLGAKGSRLRTTESGGPSKHHDASVNLMVYRRVRCIGVATSFFKGLGVVVECDQVHDMGFPGGASQKNKRDFWEFGKGSRLLQTDSLVCLALGVNDEGSCAQRLCFGVVSERNVDDLCGSDRIKFTVGILSNNLAQEVIYVLDRSVGLGGRESVMLQVRGHFFVGYEPILRSLQKHSVATIPFADVLVSKSQQSLQAPPAYLLGQNYRKFDLSCILKRPGKLEFDMAHPEQLEAFLKQREEHLILDDTQVDAFAIALTRRLALIQGPPGTGKTFVGIYVVRALLANSAAASKGAKQASDIAGINAALQDKQELPSLNPLVCICYTNHALDQFLEGLVKGGAVKLEEVVRIGSRSQSEDLQERNLERLKQGQFSKAEYTAFKQSQQEATEMAQRIELEQRRVAQGADDEDIVAWLEREYEYIYCELFEETDKDGFTTVGGTKYALQSWLGDQRGPKQIGVAEQDEARKLLNSETSPWDWPQEKRRTVWRSCQFRAEEDAKDELEKLLKRYKEVVERNKELQDGLRLRILRAAKVVGLTTSGAARNQALFRALRPRVIVCEEAGEVLESHILAAMTAGTEHVILIGDHLQLRPKVAEYALSVASGLKYDLDKSMFERCIEEFGAIKTVKAFCTLQTQRRMLPAISNLVRITLYPRLIDGDNVHAYPGLKGFVKPLWFFSHSHRESKNESQSYTNDFEASMVVALVRYAIRQGYMGQRLAVLTPYVGQLLKLRNLLANSRMVVVLGDADRDALDARGLLDDDDEGAGGSEEAVIKTVNLKESIRLATVDNFQGEEADFVIVSTVRCNPEGRTGFLREDNRVNVMLSRAKHGMLILGSMETVQKARRPAKMFLSVCKHLEQQKLVDDYVPLRCYRHGKETLVRSAAEVPDDGGCSELCLQRMECGHSCKRNCHPDDENHKAIGSCREPCAKILDCGHKCSALCRTVPCPKCTVLVKKKLLCGHVATVSCSADPTSVRCDLLVQDIPLGCGHVQTLPCVLVQKMKKMVKVPKDHPLFSCKEECGAPLACGHKCLRRCGECALFSSSKDPVGLKTEGKHWPEHDVCQSVCDRALFCGHRCKAKPCHGQTECPPCSVTCETKCQHSRCGRTCKEPCALCVEQCLWACTCNDPKPPCTLNCCYPCNRLPCNLRCGRLLPCGHRCPFVCGEKCPSVDFCQICGSDVNKSQVVDMIMFSDFKSVDLDTDPVIALSCGHIFTAASLDGLLKMNLFFERDTEDGPWTRLKPLELHVPRPTCPNCKVPICGVFRYGRILNLAAVELAQQKFLVKCNTSATNFVNREKKLTLSLTEGKPKLAQAKLVESLSNLTRECCKKVESFEADAPLLKLHNLADRSLVRIEPSRQPQVQLLIAQVGVLRLQLQCLVKSLIGNAGSKQSKEKQDGLDTTECGNVLGQLFGAHEKAVMICRSSGLKGLLDTCNNLFCGSCFVLMEWLDKLDDKEIDCKDLLKDCLEQWQRCMDQIPKKNPVYETSIKNWSNKLSGKPFYQEITKEEKKQILAAMVKDVGSGVGSFGGHWFTCPKGHVYTIGECGGAMEQSVCPECGAVVGGSNHERAAGNQVATDFLRDAEYDPNKF